MLDPRTRKRQRRRRQRIKQNQLKISFNWFLAFIVMLLWLCLGFIVIYVEPSLLKDIPFVGWYGPFFLVVFLTLLATIRFLSGNRKRALLIAGLITLFLMLRIHQLGQWHNLIIVVSIGLVIEYFWISQFNFDWRQRLKKSKDVVKSDGEPK